MKFNEKLYYLRKEHKLSQEQLADMLDVSRQSVSKWESGQTYPEMDKLLAICKIFKCDLNDLTNDEIKELNTNKQKINVDSLVDEFLNMFNKALNMFSNMDRIEWRRFIRDMIILIFALIFIRLPFEYLYEIPVSVFSNYSNPVTEVIKSCWRLVTELSCFVISVFIIIYVIKTRYLDTYDEDRVHTLKPDQSEEKPKEKSEPVIVRESNTSSILTLLGTIFIYFVKFLVIMFSMPFLMFIFVISICLAIYIYFMVNGLWYFGLLILMIAAINGLSTIIKVIINFVFNQKQNIKITIASIITALVLAGIGTGVTFIEVINTEFINAAPKVQEKAYFQEITMNNQLQINDTYYPIILNYVTDDQIVDKVKLEVTEYPICANTNININNQVVSFNYMDRQVNKDMLNLVVDNLATHKIYNYSKLCEVKVNVVTSQQNINIIKANNQRNNDQQEQFSDLNQKYSDLQEAYNELESRVNGQT